MSPILIENSYGKSQVRLTKVTRHADRHEIKELTVDVRLEGDFEASYTAGDNSRVVATDTMKNVVYALAGRHPLTDVESFGQALAGHFLEHFAPVNRAAVRLVEQPWQRVVLAGQEHPHTFLGGGGERRTATVTLGREDARIESGLEGLLLLKTTDSAFRGFVRDQYTTLPDADDRLFATAVTATWDYREDRIDWDRSFELVRRALVEAFAGHRSLSVQHTLHAMGTAALEACDAVRRITLTLPNRHRLLVNLQPFGLDNPNVIFVPTDEPFGLITGTLTRSR